MKTLLQFLARYSIVLLFVALETVAIVLLVRNNAYQRNALLSSSNAAAASIYSVGSNIRDYFRLRQTNDILQAENTRLRDRLNRMENPTDTAGACAMNILTADRNIVFIPARVINLTTDRQRNYITLNCGRRDSVDSGMGVIGPDGVVGIVSMVSEHFATVIPVLNPGISINCKFKKNGEIGALRWDGRDYRFAELPEIARHIDVQEGDTLVTSGYSAVFPPELPVGVVEKAVLTENDAYYRIRVRLATNFRRLHYVTIIRQRHADELTTLEAARKKDER